MIYKNLGNNIKKARKDKNLTQKELANRLGLSVVTIQNYENGRREPGLAVIYDIALKLDMTIAELLGYDNDLKNAELDFKNIKIDPEVVKSISSENLLEFFKSYLKYLIQSTYGHKMNLTDEQINSLMKISNNSLLPALELLNSK